MAKNKSKTKNKQGKGNKKRSRGASSFGVPITPANKFAYSFAHSLVDPCNAPLETGVYPGQTGFVTRFTDTYTFTLAATQTNGLLCFAPGTAISFVAGSVNIGDPITLSWSNTFVPGAAFLAANARGVRCLGACFEFFTNATPLNAQGIFSYGVLPVSNVPMSGTTTIQNIRTNLQNMRKVNQDAYEVKWRPGSRDEAFGPPNAQISADELDDRNCLVLIAAGLPAAQTYTIKVTWMCEWSPVVGNGLSLPLVNAETSIRPQQVVAQLDRTHPAWWHGPVGAAGSFVWQNGGRQLAAYATGSMVSQAGRMMARSQPRLEL